MEGYKHTPVVVSFFYPTTLLYTLPRLLQRRPASNLLFYKFIICKGGLWWRGVHSALNQEKLNKAKTANELKALTDAFICDTYGPLLDKLNLPETELKQLDFDTACRLVGWESSSQSKAAMMILCDQLSRNAYRGAAGMFAFDQFAQKLGLCLEF